MHFIKAYYNNRGTNLFKGHKTNMAYSLSETEILIQPSDFVNELMAQDWYDKEKTGGDAGYSDTFQSLKYQIDYNYTRYKNQLRELVKKQEELRQELRQQFVTTLLIMFAPLFLYLITMIFSFLGKYYGLFAIAYLVTYIATFPAVLIFDFFLLPAAARDLVNVLYRNIAMNKPSKNSNSKYISFEDEKAFLKKKIKTYDKFYSRIENEGIDKKGGRMGLGNPDVLTDYDKKILNEMRSMSIFEDYYASNAAMTKKASWVWLIIGFGLFVGFVTISLIIQWKASTG